MCYSWHIALMLCSTVLSLSLWFFFFIVTASSESSTLSLHDALPILDGHDITAVESALKAAKDFGGPVIVHTITDRKSTRLNSSHVATSYAGACLKKTNANYSDSIRSSFSVAKSRQPT